MAGFLTRQLARTYSRPIVLFAGKNAFFIADEYKMNETILATSATVAMRIFVHNSARQRINYIKKAVELARLDSFQNLVTT